MFIQSEIYFEIFQNYREMLITKNFMSRTLCRSNLFDTFTYNTIYLNREYTRCIRTAVVGCSWNVSRASRATRKRTARRT